MAWLFLLVAGALEVFWSTCLKFSQGLTVPKFTVCTIVGMVLSFVFLSQATKVLPLGTSYAIWTGIGALGAVVVGVVIFHESLSPARLLFVALLLVGIIGLKATSGHWGGDVRASGYALRAIQYLQRDALVTTEQVEAAE